MSQEGKLSNFERVSGFFQQIYSEKADEVLLQSAVLEQVRQGVISSGRAARLLGLTRWEFADLMAEHDVPCIDVSMEELAQEEKNLEIYLDS